MKYNLLKLALGDGFMKDNFIALMKGGEIINGRRQKEKGGIRRKINCEVSKKGNIFRDYPRV